MPKKISLLLVAVIASISMMQPTQMKANTNNSYRSDLTEEPNPLENVDAPMYAKQFGVSQDEALRRLKLQPIIGKLGSELIQKYPDIYGGLWIEHQPTYSIKVGVKSTATIGQIDSLKQLLAKAPEIANDVAYVDTKFSEAELVRAYVEIQLGIAAVRGDSFGWSSYVDIKNNKVILTTSGQIRNNYGTADMLSAIHSMAEKSPLPIDTDLPTNIISDVSFQADAIQHTQVEEMSKMRPLWNVIGGKNHDGSVPSGIAQCTLGFAIYWDPDPLNNSKRRITTAGHCPVGTYTSGVSEENVTVELIFKGVEYPGSTNRQDLRWDAPAVASNIVTNKIFTGYGVRQITSMYTWTQVQNGEYVCKYGRTTGYTCGTIETKYQDSCSWWDWLTGWCLYSFVRVSTSSKTTVLSKEGDSGGPVFLVGVAYGQVSFAEPEWAIPGGYHSYAYWPINRLSLRNLNLLTVP